ncbi:MAG: hypothetical protein J6O60_08390 [Lachnospiraceae bacterium]|nr:hypothetical protein [Lachnospiraceae bacterium]
MVKQIANKIILTLAICGVIGGFTSANVFAGNSYLDVTVSNASGLVSKDPKSIMTKKDDNDTCFYVTLTSLQNGPKIYFTSHHSSGRKVSQTVEYNSYQVGHTQVYKYNAGEGMALQKYYLYASAPRNYVNVHAVGRYCP